jgi:hypothetical protein
MSKLKFKTKVKMTTKQIHNEPKKELKEVKK